MSFDLSLEEVKQEWLACSLSASYFIVNYVQIYDAVQKTWIPFDLWRDQYKTLKELVNCQLLVILKARQLGLTWLCLAYILWLMLFHPVTTGLIFSRRETEAIYLLDDRLKNIYKRLPEWMHVRHFEQDSARNWEFSTGSSAKAFPTNAGDSYTASVVLVDEADLIPDLGSLMRSVKPTIDAGGKMILLSRSDKSRPISEFKNIYRSAKNGENDWKHVFLPWFARPTRSVEWYQNQHRDILSRTGSLDDLYEQYPKTDVEALSPKVLDKRMSPEWLLQCYVEEKGVVVGNGMQIIDVPSIPGLQIFRAPEKGRRYAIGADPAEGNPTSHESSLEVLDVITGEEVACLSGRIQPSTFASYIDTIGRFYNDADVLVERNNHGHAVLLWLGEYSELTLLSIDHYLEPNKTRKKPGWLDNSRGKTLLYDECADAFRDKETIVHCFDTFAQLASIEGSSLAAPKEQRDDRADAYALANIARIVSPSTKRKGAWMSH